MSVVWSHCFICTASLQLPAHDVLLTVHTRQKWRDTYRFVCPLCHEENVKPADERIVTLLVSSSVRIERVHIPDELDDPARWDQRRLTWDDILDFAVGAGAHDHLAREAAPWRSVQ